MDASTILLVEDNLSDVRLIQRALHKLDITNPLQVVSNGDDAVAYLAGTEQYYDRNRYPLPILVLLDLKLPRRSGAEVLMWLRQQPGLKRLPVVMLTASKECSDVNNLFDLGINAYITKPVAFDDLVKIVETLTIHWLILNEKPQVDTVA